MSEATEPAVEGEVVEPSTAVAEREAPLPEGVRPSPNYLKAVELGHVLAASGLYPGARDPAKAAVRVMIGMDLGISPTASLQSIHMWEKDGKLNIIIEGKVLASIIKQSPGYDFEIVERTAETCTLRFLRDGEPVNSGEGLAGPDVSFTMEDAERAELKNSKGQMYHKYPEEMLYWRCMAKGVRIHFPELLSGQPVYVDVEMGVEADSLKEAIAPPGPQPIQTDKAEELRRRAREIKDQITEVNPKAITGARFAQMLRNSEHSEVQLENLVEVLESNLTQEKRLVGVLAELDEVDDEKMPDSAKKALRERIERIKGPAAKVEAVEEALKQVNPEPEEGDEHGSNGE
jgi:hypothetical protein